MNRLGLNAGIVSLAIFFVALLYYGVLASKLPVLFNVDNYENFAATRYIAEHHRLPVVTIDVADSNEVRFTDLGTTRSLRPPLTYIVSAVVFELSDGLIDNQMTRLRLGSSLIAASTLLVIFLGFYLAFSNIGTAFLGAVIVAALPKFTFLAATNNDDIGAIFSVSVLFTAALALRRFGARSWVLVLLACAFGLVLQTKYTAWLTLPWFGFYVAFLLKSKGLQLLKLSPILMFSFIAAGAWWLIFNMHNYGLGDPSAMRQATQLQSQLSDITPNSRGYQTLGVGAADLLRNHDQFLSKSYRSMVGYLDWIALEMSSVAYWFYGAVLCLGLLSLSTLSRRSLRDSKYLDLLILGIILGQCVFYVHHNLVRDIQPQGRYLLPLLMPVIYLFLGALSRVPNDLFTIGLKNSEYRARVCMTFCLILICGLIHLNVMLNHVRPSYLSKAYFTKLEPSIKYALTQMFESRSGGAIQLEPTSQGLDVTRVARGQASISLTDNFCKALPENALVYLNIVSPSNGALILRLNGSNQRGFDDAIWQPFFAGQARVTFSVNAKRCTDAVLSLGSDTHLLTIQSVDIAELKIHQYGNPI